MKVPGALPITADAIEAAISGSTHQKYKVRVHLEPGDLITVDLRDPRTGELVAMAQKDTQSHGDSRLWKACVVHWTGGMGSIQNAINYASTITVAAGIATSLDTLMPPGTDAAAPVSSPLLEMVQRHARIGD